MKEPSLIEFDDDIIIIQKNIIKNLKKIKEYQDYVKLNPRGVQKDFQGRILKKYSKII